jgi:hypothetical protein
MYHDSPPRHKDSKKLRQRRNILVTDLLPNHDPREYNASVLVTALDFLRRQPWKVFAATALDAAKRFLTLGVLAALFLPAMAQARSYDVMHADVPFKFEIGHRTFRPGHYDFIIVGPGLLALRDAHAHIIASLVVRERETNTPQQTSKLTFNRQKKNFQLAEVWIERHSQVLEVVGEELAIQQHPAYKPDVPSAAVNSMFERRQTGIKY